LNQNLYLNCHIFSGIEVNIQAEITVIQGSELKSIAMNCLGHSLAILRSI